MKMKEEEKKREGIDLKVEEKEKRKTGEKIEKVENREKRRRVTREAKKRESQIWKGKKEEDMKIIK